MAERRVLSLVATVLLLAFVLSILAVYALLPTTWQASDSDGNLTTVTLLNPVIGSTLFYAATLLTLAVVGAAVIAKWRPTIRSPSSAVLLVVLAWLIANLVHTFNNAGPWTEHGQVTTENRKYVFLDSSFLQGQTMALGQQLPSGLLTTRYRVLVTNNGDWPRSWASVIRPAKAVERYGQLYLTATNILIGIRTDNRCFLAFDLRSGRAIGHGDIESLSPFVCLTKTSSVHTPDITATINTINQVIAFCWNDQDIRHAAGFLAGECVPGCPSRAAIEQGLTHGNPAVAAASRQMLATHNLGIKKLTPRIEAEVSKQLPLLTSSNVQLRRDAALALGEIRGPGADAAIPELVQAVNNDEDRDVREYALQSLGFLGDAALASIVELLDSTDPLIRSRAIAALNQMGEAANTPAILEQVQEALGDDDSDVRSSARRFLDNHPAKKQ